MLIFYGLCNNARDSEILVCIFPYFTESNIANCLAELFGYVYFYLI